MDYLKIQNLTPMKENYMKMRRQEKLFLADVLFIVNLQYGNVQNAINKFGKEIVCKHYTALKPFLLD